jgi:hypothetical protein
MLAEHDTAVLNADMLSHALVAGDVGVVVHVYAGGKAYEVEFVRYDGTSSGTVTLEASLVRSAGPRDVPHVRELAA